MSAAIQKQIAEGAVPNHVSNVCPEGTKMWVLEVGWLEADEGFVVRGGNTSLKSTEDKPFVNKRRALPMYCILIEHPIEGLILWETGCGKDYPTVRPHSTSFGAIGSVLMCCLGLGPSSLGCVLENSIRTCARTRCCHRSYRTQGRRREEDYHWTFASRSRGRP